MISLVDLITERISSDVESAGKKAGIKFNKKTKNLTTNKYSNPKGDVSRMGKDHESVKMNDWMSDDRVSGGVDKSNFKEAGEQIIKTLKSKYKLVKYDKMGSGVFATFIKDKKNPRTEFTISYAKTIAGPYVSYTGVYGE